MAIAQKAASHAFLENQLTDIRLVLNVALKFTWPKSTGFCEGLGFHTDFQTFFLNDRKLKMCIDFIDKLGF